MSPHPINWQFIQTGVYEKPLRLAPTHFQAIAIRCMNQNIIVLDLCNLTYVPNKSILGQLLPLPSESKHFCQSLIINLSVEEPQDKHALLHLCVTTQRRSPMGFKITHRIHNLNQICDPAHVRRVSSARKWDFRLYSFILTIIFINFEASLVKKSKTGRFFYKWNKSWFCTHVFVNFPQFKTHRNQNMESQERSSNFSWNKS